MCRAFVVMGATQVHVFEGFFDWLSWLVLTNRPAPDGHVLVLNSVAMGDKAINLLREWEGLETVYLHLDRDNAGKALTIRMQAELSGLVVRDQSPQYAGFKGPQ